MHISKQSALPTVSHNSVSFKFDSWRSQRSYCVISCLAGG